MSCAIVDFLDCGVDYITSTSASRSSTRELLAVGEKLMKREYRNGGIEKSWGMSGFTGWCCGHVQMGRRGQEGIVRLGSIVAQDKWRMVHAAGSNVSRLDLQVTTRTETPARKSIARHFRQASRWSKASPGRSTVSIFSTSDGPSTVYCGKRSSDQFGRIYDKGAESGLDHWTNAVRYEVEMKAERAMRAADFLASQSKPLVQVQSLVSTFFSGRGCDLQWTWADTNISCPRSRSDLERRLRWIEESVRPSVLLLMHRGKSKEVLAALGLVQTARGKLTTLQLAKRANAA